MPADSIPRMDPNSGSGNESSNSINDNIFGTSPGASSLRSRTDSESSDKMTRFILPSVDGSPPKVVTMNEVANVLKNMKNMELAHEIALNPDYKLQPYEPPENSLERRIKDVMHQVFWDGLRTQLQQTPPRYDHAIQLLSEIKDSFPEIISPNNKRALEHINEVLDESVIRQQAEQGVLDFRAYANFVIQIMAKSCAPARDEQVEKLKNIDDVVETFRGILECMTLLKLDMTNFLLDSARKDILNHSVEYEKEKFKEYLEYYKFGFPATEDWLKRNCTSVNCTAEQASSNSYVELMDWPESKEFPEILSIDKERILKLGQRAKRLTVASALISICSAVSIISQRSENRIALAKQIEILLQDVNNEKDIQEAIANIWEQIKSSINGFLQKEQQAIMEQQGEQMLKNQILEIASQQSPVRSLMSKRLQIYFRLALRSQAGLPPPPPGYVDFKDELEAFANALKRVIVYNHSVFGDYFMQILQKQTQTQNEAAIGNTASTSQNPQQ